MVAATLISGITPIAIGLSASNTNSGDSTALRLGYRSLSIGRHPAEPELLILRPRHLQAIYLVCPCGFA
jgi:hypothetical protein